MRTLFAAYLIAFLAWGNFPGIQQHTPKPQDESPITVEAYWQRVADLRQALLQMDSLSGEEVRRQLDELAGAWEKVTMVQFLDGQIMAIDSTRLSAELKADPPDLKHLLALTDALLAAHEKYPRTVFTAQDVKPLREILARPEFQWNQSRVIETPDWFQKIIDAFFNFIEHLAYLIGNIIYYGRVPILMGLVILFLFGLYHFSKNLSDSLVREAQLAAEDGSDDLLTSKGAMQRAQLLSNQGDYRNAIRYLYLSSLLVLDERGLMRYDRSRTNREYLRSVASKPRLESPLHNVIDVFDRVWYGYEEVDEKTFQAYAEHVDELREAKE